MRYATNKETILFIIGMLVFVIVSVLLINHMEKYDVMECQVTKVEGNVVYVEGARNNIYGFYTKTPENFSKYDRIKLKFKTQNTPQIEDDEIIDVLERF